MEKYGLPETDHRPSRGAGRGHLVVRVPSLSSSPDWRLHVVDFDRARKESSATGCVRLAAASTIGRRRTQSWSCKTARTAEMYKCFEHTLRRMEYVTTGSTHSSSWRISRKMATAQSRWSNRACKKEVGA